MWTEEQRALPPVAATVTARCVPVWVTLKRYVLPDRIAADTGSPCGSAGLRDFTKLEVRLIRLRIRISTAVHTNRRVKERANAFIAP